MKKKVWDIQVKDEPNQVKQIENDAFYTTDTEAYLMFNLHDKQFQPETALLTLENLSDGSLKDITVDVEFSVIEWEMPKRFIEHSGKWQGQLVYYKQKEDVPEDTPEEDKFETYTSAPFTFVVNAHIGDKKKPSLVEIENWEKFIREGTELIETWEDLEALREENERQRQANEQSRETAESVRVSNEEERELNEAKRISKDSERDSKIEAVEGLQADLISGAVDSASVQQHVETRYGELESEYAENLGELKRNDKKLTAQLAQATYDVSELQGFVGYTDHDIVGIEADLQNRRVTRIAGAVNRTPGQSFDNIRAFGGRRRCTVADDGEVLGYYGESGYDETGETGQVMVEQPKFYYKVVPLKLDKIEDGKGFHMRKARYYVSDSPKEGFKVHPTFVDENGKIRQCIYLSAFEGSIFDVSNDTYLKNDEQIADFNVDMLSSIPGVKPASGLSQALSLTNSRKLANNRGLGWGLSYSASTSLTQMLFAIEYASFNTQEELGYGVLGKPPGGGNRSEITGATISLGNSSGFIERNGFEVPTYRGEENFYGNIWKWVDGLNIKPQGIHELYVATHGFLEHHNTGMGTYENAEFTLAKSDGYVSAFGYGNEDLDWLFFPSETSGNSSVPVGDSFWQISESTTAWLSAVLGSSWNHFLDGGGFFWAVTYPSSSPFRYRGSRMVYTPKGGN